MGFLSSALSCVDNVGNRACLILLASIFLLLWRQMFPYWTQRTLGGKIPRAVTQFDPILGLDILWQTLGHLRRRTMLDSIYKKHQTIGKTYSFVICGQRCIETIEPENIRALHTTQFDQFSVKDSRYKAMRAVLGDGVFTSDGSTWKENRALLRTYFSKAHLLNLDKVEHHVEHFIARIPRDGSTVDLQRLSLDLTADIITEFLFGRSVKSLSDGPDKLQEFGHTLDAAETLMGDRARVGLFFPVYGSRTLDKYAKILHGFVDSHINTAEKALIDHRRMETEGQTVGASHWDDVVVYDLLKRTSNKIQIRDNLMALMVAGRDTLAGSVAMVFYMLARHPRVWNQLEAEIMSKFGAHRKPTLAEARSLPYLKQVYDETLRLYPPLPWNPRVALRDTVLPRGGGQSGTEPLFIRKGTLVGFSSWSLGRNKDVFGSDCEEFRPERWDKLGELDWAHFLPFGAGPKKCPGQEFATMLAAYLLVRTIQEYSAIDNRDSEPFREGLRLTLSSGEGVQVALTPRKH